jgi:hypothetical protein
MEICRDCVSHFDSLLPCLLRFGFSLGRAADMGACRSGISADNGAPFPATFQDFAPLHRISKLA